MAFPERPDIAELKKAHAFFQPAGDTPRALLELPPAALSLICALLDSSSDRMPPFAIDSFWDELNAVLPFHDIYPLFYWVVKNRGAGHLLSAEHYTLLQQQYVVGCINSDQMGKQLDAVCAAFADHSIPLIVLKGPALGRLYYPAPELRPSSDIDLLVNPRDFIVARKLLEGIGYRCLDRRFEKAQTFYSEEIFEHVHNSDEHYCIELHWELHSRGRVGRLPVPGTLFDNAVPLALASSSCKTLHPVDALIYAAVHMLVNHGKSIRLIWLYDIAMLAGALTEPADWKLLRQRSATWGAVRAVQTALQLARLWTGLPLQAGCADPSEWPQPAAEEEKDWEHVLHRRDSAFHRIADGLQREGGILKKLLFLLNAVFPSPAVVRSQYPVSCALLLPLSYMKRWMYWLVKRDHL